MKKCSKCKLQLRDGEGIICSDCNRDLLEKILKNPDTTPETELEIKNELRNIDRFEAGQEIENLSSDEITLDQEDLFDWS